MSDLGRAQGLPLWLEKNDQRNEMPAIFQPTKRWATMEVEKKKKIKEYSTIRSSKIELS